MVKNINNTKRHLKTNSNFFTTRSFSFMLFSTFVFLKMNREHNFAWSRDQFSKLLWHGKSENTRYRKNTCLKNRFCTGSGRRTPALKFCQNSYGFVGPPVVSSVENHKEDRGLGRLVEFVTETPYSSRFICIPYSSRFMNNYFICS